MFYIRVDGNADIGTGHSMRCLSIARAMSDRGIPVVFLLAEESIEPLVVQAGFTAIVLHTDYCDMESELPILQGKIRGNDNFILVDSYQVTGAYLRQLHRFGKVAYLDDLNKFPYPVDYLINYNLYADVFSYPEQVEGIARKLLLGCKYTPLRKEFLAVAYQVRAEAKNILITTGGGDPYNLAAQILQEAVEDKNGGCRNFEYHVISGRFHKNLPELMQLAKKYPGIHIYQDIKNMAELMQKCDIAITAGGTTVYELCAVGIPFLCFAFVDNQKGIIKSFREKGIVHYSGDYSVLGSRMFPALWEAVQNLADDYPLRKGFYEKGRKLVDGHGADRIADVFLQDRKMV